MNNNGIKQFNEFCHECTAEQLQDEMQIISIQQQIVQLKDKGCCTEKLDEVLGILEEIKEEIKGKKEEGAGQSKMAPKMTSIEPEEEDDEPKIDEPATEPVEEAKKKARKCKKCGTEVKKDGKCGDKTCPYSDRKQWEKFKED